MQEHPANNGCSAVYACGPLPPNRQRYINPKLEQELVEFKEEVEEKFAQSELATFIFPRIEVQEDDFIAENLQQQKLPSKGSDRFDLGQFLTDTDLKYSPKKKTSKSGGKRGLLDHTQLINYQTEISLLEPKIEPQVNMSINFDGIDQSMPIIQRGEQKSNFRKIQGQLKQGQRQFRL